MKVPSTTGLRARAGSLVLAAGVALAAAGCGGPSSPSAVPERTPAGPAFNQADVDFVVHMSQHHGQALQMAELAVTKARSEGVTRLARRIVQARAPEVDQFGAWLLAWGEAGARMPPHGIGDDHDGPGMLKEAEVARLATLRATPFDRTFLDLMVRHHRGGVQLTRAEIAGGRNGDAVRLARDIQAATDAAITEMLAIRNSLPA